jgi:hypothetical protein
MSLTLAIFIVLILTVVSWGMWMHMFVMFLEFELDGKLRTRGHFPALEGRSRWAKLFIGIPVGILCGSIACFLALIVGSFGASQAHGTYTSILASLLYLILGIGFVRKTLLMKEPARPIVGGVPYFGLLLQLAMYSVGKTRLRALVFSAATMAFSLTPGGLSILRAAGV